MGQLSQLEAFVLGLSALLAMLASGKVALDVARTRHKTTGATRNRASELLWTLTPLYLLAVLSVLVLGGRWHG